MLKSNQKKRRRLLFKLFRRAKSNRGEGYIDVVVMTITAMLVLCTILSVYCLYGELESAV
jgi:hypothetical protein